MVSNTHVQIKKKVKKNDNSKKTTNRSNLQRHMGIPRNTKNKIKKKVNKKWRRRKVLVVEEKEEVATKINTKAKMNVKGCGNMNYDQVKIMKRIGEEKSK